MCVRHGTSFNARVVARQETQGISLNGSDDDAVSVRTGATSMSRSSGATAKLTAASQTRGSCARCGS